MTNDIKIFDNPQFGELRTITDESGEPWFVAKDVATVIGFTNTHDATKYLDDDEKGETISPTLGGNQRMTTVNEAGFYSMVLKSRKPEAKAFKRWVTHEVLPEIRKSGGYMVAKPDEPDDVLMARALLIADRAIKRKDAIIEELKPKALFADAVGASDGTCLVGELAKMLRQNGIDIGQNRLFEWLRENGYLGKSNSNRNVPTQKAMDAGLFRIKETAVTHADGHVTITRTPKVTGKGQRYFIDKFIGGAECAAC